MRIKTLAITTGAVLALAGGLYLGSGAQAGEATCIIGGDTGPGVPVMLAAQSEPKPAAPQPTSDKNCTSQKPKQTQEQQGDQAKDKDKEAAKPKGAAPIVPIIAPDEGC